MKMPTQNSKLTLMQADWFKVYNTTEELEKDWSKIKFKYNGDGWYFHGKDSMLIISDHEHEIIYVQVWNGVNALLEITKMCNLTVRKYSADQKTKMAKKANEEILMKEAW
jgi:hypothetical protein